MGSEKKQELVYAVERNKNLGRFLVAARDIEGGEIIISEEPLLTAPSDSPRSSNGNPIDRCLGCCMEIETRERLRCYTCFFPCCSVNCQQLPAHADNECSFLVEHHATFPLVPHCSVFYKSIMVLRALLLKSKDKAKWKSLLEMEAHFELRQDKPNASTADDKVIGNIRHFFGGEEGPGSDEIRRVSGIIDVNAHLLPQSINGKSCFAGVCHIFEETSLLCHSCVPNAAWAVSQASDTTLVTRASTHIPKGTQICVSYDAGEALYGTLRRLIPLEISGLFVCRCPRCIDPTELGTNLSTLICDKCSTGHVLPSDSTDSFSNWICQTCSSVKAEEDVLDLLEYLETEIEFPQFNLLFSCSEESIQVLQDFKSAWSGSVLHPNHYILVQVNFRWIKQHSLNNFREMAPAQLRSTYLPACRELIGLSDIILPGESEFKAILQYHLCNGIVHLQKLGESVECEEEELDRSGQDALQYFLRHMGFETFIIKLEGIFVESSHGDLKGD